MTEFRWSQDVLRFACYISGGYVSAIFPWYFGFPLLFLGVFLGLLIENIDEISKEKNDN